MMDIKTRNIGEKHKVADITLEDQNDTAPMVQIQNSSSDVNDRPVEFEFSSKERILSLLYIPIIVIITIIHGYSMIQKRE